MRTRPLKCLLVAIVPAMILCGAAMAQKRVMRAPSEAELRYLQPPKSTDVPDEGASVEMHRLGSRPVIAATINGTGPYRFIVDTGSSISVILDRTVATKIGLATGEDLNIAGMKSQGVTLDSVELGDVKLAGVPALVNDIGKFLGGGADAPVGILGVGLFSDCLFTYDFPSERFRFERGSLPEPGGAVVPYRYVGAIELDVDVAGHTIAVHLDTGAPGMLLVTNSYDEVLPLEAPPVSAGSIRTPMGGADARDAKLAGSLRIAGHEYPSPMVRFADLPQIVERKLGNVGMGILGDFAVTFDQKNRRLRLQK